MEIENIARILSENGIQYAALTDHVEFDREPLPDVLTKLKIRNLEIDAINEKYQGKITLLKGVEISSPHLYQAKVESLKELKLDLIMGSIHKIDKYASNPKDIQKVYHRYYREILKMVEADQIDIVGHLDYINRYYGHDYSNIHQVLEILKAIKEHNQIIEITTSAKRRCQLNLFPSIEKICAYSWQNKEVVIGTDAHIEDELLDNLEQPQILIEEINLQPVILKKRKIERI